MKLQKRHFRASYDDIADLGFAVAQKLDNKAPDSKIEIKRYQKLAEKIALSLKNAKNPLIISGISCGDEADITCSFKYCNCTFVCWFKCYAQYGFA